MKRRRGQAMVETLLAVLIVTSVFLVLFKLNRMLTGEIMLQHAAMRVARARTVGFNDYLCRKAARIAVIPVAGKRTWPTDESFSDDMELARVGLYMNTPNESYARALLDYEDWMKLRVEPGEGQEARVSLETDWFDLRGKAALEAHFPFYMNNEGR